MREFKILMVVLFFTLLTYWGVEPYAHAQMHPHVAPADFEFRDIEPLHVKGDASKGMELVSINCIACHGIDSQGFKAPLLGNDAASAYGVTPPDLSSAGAIYDKNYLAGFLKEPTKTAQLEHKFKESKPYPMPSYSWMSEQEIADIIAYFGSIAPQVLSNKGVFRDACGRCHSMKYNGLKSQTSPTQIASYLGAQAPDMSMMIRSKQENYLHTFINQPLKMVEGIAMPRVGLNENAQNQVISYIESVGDSKKSEREDIGYKIMIYMAVFTLFAYLWKVKIWKEVE